MLSHKREDEITRLRIHRRAATRGGADTATSPAGRRSALRSLRWLRAEVRRRGRVFLRAFGASERPSDRLIEQGPATVAGHETRGLVGGDAGLKCFTHPDDDSLSLSRMRLLRRP